MDWTFVVFCQFRISTPTSNNNIHPFEGQVVLIKLPLIKQWYGSRYVLQMYLIIASYILCHGDWFMDRNIIQDHSHFLYFHIVKWINKTPNSFFSLFSQVQWSAVIPKEHEEMREGTNRKQRERESGRNNRMFWGRLSPLLSPWNPISN